MPTVPESTVPGHPNGYVSTVLSEGQFRRAVVDAVETAPWCEATFDSPVFGMKPHVVSGESTLRIGFIVDRFDVGGSELNAVKTAELLRSHEVAVTVFHFQRDGVLRRRYEALGCELVHVPLHGLFSRSALRAIATIHRVATAQRVSVLHAQCVYSNIVGAALRLRVGQRIPFVASRRWTGSLPRKALNALNRIAQSGANLVAVNAPSLVKRVEAESPFSRPVYVPNLLPDRAFVRVDPDTRRLMRRDVGLTDENQVVGCVARLTPVKNHAGLLRAWPVVSSALPTARLLVIGDGPLKADLEHLSRELGVADSVIFTGERAPESLPHAMLDLHVLVSLDEGFPNSIIEAMAQEVPNLATRVGGIPDIVTDGANGILVNVDDSVALSTAILDVFGGRYDRTALVSAAACTANEHRADIVLGRLKHVYEEAKR